jgi:hypothetical protein
MPAAIRGIRTFHTIVLLDGAPPPSRVFNISTTESPEEPTEIDNTHIEDTTAASASKIIHFLLMYRL